MGSELQFFVDDESGSRGPLSIAALRAEVGDKRGSPRVRADGTDAWLPASAWEALTDLGPPPGPPSTPTGPPASALPAELASIAPALRERLLFYVADADGVMGPVNGEFVRKGLASGQIPVGAGVCLVANGAWVRASVVFPGATEGVTALRGRALATSPCPACFEPVAAGDRECPSCSEPLERYRPLERRRVIAIGLATYGVLLALVTVASIVYGALRTRAPAPPAAASSAAVAASSAPPIASATPVTRSRGHVTGDIAAKLDIGADANDVLPLAGDRVAVARRTALEVVDAKTGALAFTAADLPSLKAIYAVGDVLYGLAPRRIAVIDAESVRALKWIEVGAQPGAIAASEGSLALALVPSDQAVVVIDTTRHAEVERFRFDERLGAVTADERGTVAVATVGDAKAPKASDDAVIVFDPSRFASAQPIHRVAFGEPAVAAAIAPSDTHAAVALGRSSGVVRVDLGPGAAVFATARQKTCEDPAALRFARSVLVVACRRGAAIAIHDPETLELKQQVAVGGPVLTMELSPDGLQALAVVGAPAAGVVAIDLAHPGMKRLAIDEEIASARYGRGGTSAIAFAPKGHHAWVIR